MKQQNVALPFQSRPVWSSLVEISSAISHTPPYTSPSSTYIECLQPLRIACGLLDSVVIVLVLVLIFGPDGGGVVPQVRVVSGQVGTTGALGAGGMTAFSVVINAVISAVISAVVNAEINAVINAVITAVSCAVITAVITAVFR